MMMVDTSALEQAIDNAIHVKSCIKNGTVDNRLKRIVQEINDIRFGFKFESHVEIKLEGLVDVIIHIFKAIGKAISRAIEAIKNFFTGEKNKLDKINKALKDREEKIKELKDNQKLIEDNYRKISIDRDLVEHDLYLEVVDKKIKINYKHALRFMSKHGNFDTSPQFIKSALDYNTKYMEARKVFFDLLNHASSLDLTRTDKEYWKNFGNFTPDGSEDGAIVKKYKEYLSAIAIKQEPAEKSIHYTFQPSELSTQVIELSQTGNSIKDVTYEGKNKEYAEKAIASEESMVPIVSIDELVKINSDFNAEFNLRIKAAEEIDKMQASMSKIYNKIETIVKNEKVLANYDIETMGYIKLIYIMICGYLLNRSDSGLLDSIIEYEDKCVNHYMSVMHSVIKT